MSVNTHPVFALLPLMLDRLPVEFSALLRQAGVPVQNVEEGGPAGQFVLYDARMVPFPVLQPGQMPLDVSAWWPAEGVQAEGKTTRRAWMFQGYQLEEDVACHNLKDVRGPLLAGLKLAVEAAGGVWATFAVCPFPYRSAFNMRLDYDEFHAADFASVQRSVAQMPEAFSHYLCASSHAPQSEALNQLRGHDVGSHGFWHYTHANRADNLHNIWRGILALQDAGIDPVGFVAPHGRFNAALLEVLTTLGVPYSSEFACSYDDLPFYPAQGRVLQLPVHPVCLGLFLEAARRAGKTSEFEQHHAANACADYFQQVARIKYKNAEPIFFYGHPDGRLGRYPQVLQRLLDEVGTFGSLWKTTFRQFAGWWQQRLKAKAWLYRQGDRFLLQTSQRPTGWTAMVEFWRGSLVARLPVREDRIPFTPAALVYEPQRVAEMPGSQPLPQETYWKAKLRQELDWERTTPPEELKNRSLRGWTKWFLRRMAG